MAFRNRSTRCLAYTLLSLVFVLFPAVTQAQTVLLKFAVMAMTEDNETRTQLEDQLVARLMGNNYDVVASHTLLPDIDSFEPLAVRTELLDSDIQAILLLRPIAIEDNVSIASIQQYLSPDAYNSVAEFVSAYRGDNLETQAVVHVAGFLLDNQRSRLFWQGVVWLDDQVSNRQEGIDKIIDLVEFNLNQSRSALRFQLGFPPLDP